MLLAAAAAVILLAVTAIGSLVGLAAECTPDIGTVVLVGLAVVAVRSARDDKSAEAGLG